MATIEQIIERELRPLPSGASAEALQSQAELAAAWEELEAGTRKFLSSHTWDERYGWVARRSA